MHNEIDFMKTIKGWVILSRPPFHLVGVLPFFLGAILAWRINSTFDWSVFLWSIAAVILIMLSTYYSGEYYDLKEDRLSAQMGKNIFSGGSQAVVKGLVPKGHALIASYITLGLAGIIGLLLQFHYKTGPLTTPLGLTGMAAGFFYSTRPIRWVKRGVGEVIIGFSYGWLPVAASYYLQCGRIDPIVHFASLPIAFSIFNVILINEFPDYPADLIEKKANLVVRVGKKRALCIYIAMAIASLCTYPLPLLQGIPPMTYLWSFPVVFAILLVSVVWVSRGGYQDRVALEKICALTLLLNLTISLSYIITLLQGKT